MAGRAATTGAASLLAVGHRRLLPDLGESIDTATDFCERCEVRAECLETELADPRAAGIWGGVSERGRRILRWSAA
jgi:WhiB family redox-sensing transcriptional regulator